MTRLVTLKLIRLVPVMFLVSVLTFSLLEVAPGDPALTIMGDNPPCPSLIEQELVAEYGEETDISLLCTQAVYQSVRERFNLDDPIWERYLIWLGNAATGDLGIRLTNQSFTVLEGIQQTFPVTLQIAIFSMGLALLVSIPMGVWAAFHQGKGFDRLSGGSSFAIISIPSFLIGLLLIFFFVWRPWMLRNVVLLFAMIWVAWLLWSALKRIVSRIVSGSEARAHATTDFVLATTVALVALGLYFWWPDFPRQGFSRWTSDEGILENFRTAFLPALTVALTEIAVFTRLLRSDIIATLQEDFILSARARGFSNRRIMFRHALRPSSFSLITLAGVAFGRALGGTVIVETIFRLPGMGRYIVDQGVRLNDYTVVMGGVLVLTTAVVLLNTGVDIAYYYLDPRIRRGRR